MIRILMLVLLVVLLRALDAPDKVADSGFGSRQSWKSEANRRMWYDNVVGALSSCLQL